MSIKRYAVKLDSSEPMYGNTKILKEFGEDKEGAIQWANANGRRLGVNPDLVYVEENEYVSEANLSKGLSLYSRHIWSAAFHGYSDVRNEEEMKMNLNEKMYFLSDPQIVSNDVRLYTLEELGEYMKERVEVEREGFDDEDLEDLAEYRAQGGFTLDSQVKNNEENILKWCSYFGFDVENYDALEFLNEKFQNDELVLKVWPTEDHRDQGLADYYHVKDLKDGLKQLNHMNEVASAEIVIDNDEETLIYHKSPEDEFFDKDVLCIDYRKDLGCFIDNIQINDVELYDKLDDLCAEEQISDECFEVLKDNEKVQEEISKKVIEWVKNGSEAAEMLKEEMSHFTAWYDKKDLTRFDYSDALYNCDRVYLDTIAECLEISVEELEAYDEKNSTIEKLDSNRLRMVIELDIDEDLLPENGLKAENVLENITLDFFLNHGTVISKELISKNEKEKNQMIENLVNTVEDLNDNVPDGYIVDADTILVDLIQNQDLEFTGFAQDIFDIYRNSQDKKAVKQMFYEFTGMEFDEYLEKCEAEITRNELETTIQDAEKKCKTMKQENNKDNRAKGGKENEL